MKEKFRELVHEKHTNFYRFAKERNWKKIIRDSIVGLIFLAGTTYVLEIIDNQYQEIASLKERATFLEKRLAVTEFFQQKDTGILCDLVGTQLGLSDDDIGTACEDAVQQRQDIRDRLATWSK